MAWYNFFTGSKAIDTVSDIASGAMSGIDKLCFTDEEKADFSTETMKVWLEVQRVTAGESSIKSITRRLIAVAFCFSYLGLLLVSCAVWKLDPAYSTHIFKTAQDLSTIVITIVFFYFGYYAVANILKEKK